MAAIGGAEGGDAQGRGPVPVHPLEEDRVEVPGMPVSRFHRGQGNSRQVPESLAVPLRQGLPPGEEPVQLPELGAKEEEIG